MQNLEHIHLQDESLHAEREVAPELIDVGNAAREYLYRLGNEVQNPALQQSPFTDCPWGEVVRSFTRDLDGRLDKAQNTDQLTQVLSPVVLRGMELVSGGVVSARDLEEGDRRGLAQGGTWPDAPGAEFWDPRVQRKEQEVIRSIVGEVLELKTDASVEHIGRVLTMSLPALLSWADLRGEMTSREEVVEAVSALLASEKKGQIDVVTFGCEPYQYGFAPQTTTGHIRRSAFGSADTIRMDAMRGSFRGVRRILEPLDASGVEANYRFHTSFGTSYPLIQRQVMPDTANFYRRERSPEEMLEILGEWRDTIYSVGSEELEGSNVSLSMVEMEREVVLPALVRLARVLHDCGMSMPEDAEEFLYNSEGWFTEHARELNYLDVVRNHPDPQMLLEFVINEEEWSRKHPEAYSSEKERIAQAALLSFFELHQYERINELIGESDFAVGVEIDEELIMKVRGKSRDCGEDTRPLIWGRPSRYSDDGVKGGVAHRQPWFNE